MTIVEFLEARIVEDELEAKGYLDDLATCPPSVYDMQQVGWIDSGSPERVLAVCEAHRRIVALHDPVPVHGCPDEPGGMMWDEGPCVTLRLLALPYAEHPDYREEWRP